MKQQNPISSEGDISTKKVLLSAFKTSEAFLFKEALCHFNPYCFTGNLFVIASSQLKLGTFSLGSLSLESTLLPPILQKL